MHRGTGGTERPCAECGIHARHLNRHLSSQVSFFARAAGSYFEKPPHLDAARKKHHFCPFFVIFRLTPER